MKDQRSLRQPRLRALIVRMLLVVAFALPSSTAFAAQQFQGPGATLILQVPAQVQLGDRIEIQMIVDHAQDLAGYEAQLLFDTTAAHFSGFEQRDSDLKKFGRDVIPLEEGELSDGVTMGLASCPYQDCVNLKGNPKTKGANGRVRLGTVIVGTDQQGRLELRLDHLKFIDSNGNTIPVNIAQPVITVQVGADNGVTFTSPASTWQLTPTASNAANYDVNGDGIVNYADAAEVALEWKMSREQGQLCGPANDLSRDTNGDGCIDVSDIQFVLANTVGKNQKTPATGPNSGSNAGPTTSAATGSTAVLSAAPMTFTVNSTSDAADSTIGNGICATSTGECTLRAAISEANSHTGPDSILFNVPGGGVQTIQLNSRLPTLSDGSGGTTIDGYSQPGAQPNTDSLISNAQIMVQIRGNGPGAFDAMQITSAGNVIRGLSFFNDRRSLWFYGSGAQYNVIAGDFLGTNAAGTFGLTAYFDFAYGLEFENGAFNNQIGGTSAADRNVISGNARTGLDFNSDATDNNVVYNNIIGLNPSGTGRLPNMRHGIDMNSGPSYNIIGGTDPGKRNILSGNGEDQNVVFIAGIEISHTTLTSFNQVIGNCIGTDPTCTSGPSWALNRHYGVNLEDGTNNNIIANNVIGNNPQGGIRVTGTGSNRNQIRDNRIGISLNNSAIPNGNFGIQIARAAKFITVGPNNIITNTSRGMNVLDDGTDNITITQNSIFNNGTLGIDLGPTTGVNQNDGGDADTGPNEGLNWPVLTSATPTQVTGTACTDSVVPKPCKIEVFIAERRTGDTGGGNYGQGKAFVGFGTTNSNGSFAVAIIGVTAGQYLTTTATDAAGNTSEFSQNIQVATGGGGGGPTTFAKDTFTRNITSGWGNAETGGGYTLIGTASNFNVNGFSGTMAVQSAGGALYAKLPGVTTTDLDFVFRLKTDKPAVGNNQIAFFLARSISNNTEYRGQLRISTSNSVFIRALKVVNGSQTNLGTEITVPGLTYSAGSYIWMHGQVVGTNPTTIRLKAWADGQAEPSGWQFTVTDSEPSLQVAGSVGLRSYLASGVTNAPVVFTFDDLLVTTP
jgi:CSLREA domain-containing protein